MTLLPTPEQRAEWRRLAEAATAGPWIRIEHKNAAHFGAQPFGIGISIGVANQGFRGPEVYADGHDAAFIAAAREAVPALLDALDALEAELKQAQETQR